MLKGQKTIIENFALSSEITNIYVSEFYLNSYECFLYLYQDR